MPYFEEGLETLNFTRRKFGFATPIVANSYSLIANIISYWTNESYATFKQFL